MVEREDVRALQTLGGRFLKWHDMLDVLYAAKNASPAAELEDWKRIHGEPSHKDWTFDRLNQWVESVENSKIRDRLFDTLDFFELN